MSLVRNINDLSNAVVMETIMVIPGFNVPEFLRQLPELLDRLANSKLDQKYRDEILRCLNLPQGHANPAFREHEFYSPEECWSSSSLALFDSKQDSIFGIAYARNTPATWDLEFGRFREDTMAKVLAMIVAREGPHSKADVVLYDRAMTVSDALVATLALASRRS